MSCLAGLGTHFYDLSSEKQVAVVRTLLVDYAIFLWSWSLPKLSIALLLHRIFKSTTRVTIAFFSLAGLSIGLSGVEMSMWLTQCVPTRKIWEPQTTGHCNNSEAMYIVFVSGSAVSGVTDIVFAVYPAWKVSKLQMSSKRKLAVAIPLMCGLAAAAATAYKTVTFEALTGKGVNDPSWNSVNTIVCTSVEANILIFGANLATLVKLPQTITKSGWYNWIAQLFKSSSRSVSTSSAGVAAERRETETEMRRWANAVSQGTTTYYAEDDRRESQVLDLGEYVFKCESIPTLSPPPPDTKM